MTQLPTAPSEPGEVICPFCGSAETELFAMFGQFLLASPHYCRACKTVFDVVRWEEPARATPAEERKAHFTGGHSSNQGGTGEDTG
jgi:hypothetical protein